MLLVGGLVAFGAYKLSTRDADRIEEHTGKTADQLSDQEIEQAMEELNIQGEELTDEDYDYLDQQEAAEADDEPGYLDELERLAQLHQEGVITDEEFAEKKKQLLGL